MKTIRAKAALESMGYFQGVKDGITYARQKLEPQLDEFLKASRRTIELIGPIKFRPWRDLRKKMEILVKRGERRKWK